MLRALAATAAVTLTAAAPSHYQAGVLRACLDSRPETVWTRPFATSGFGGALPRTVERRVLVALFITETRTHYRFSPYTFFVFGRDGAEARRISARVEREVSKLLPRPSARSISLNVAWFASGTLTPDVSVAILGCLDKARRGG